MFNVFSKCLTSDCKFNDLSLEEKKKFNSFMFCRWLSGNTKTLQIADFFNYYSQFIPDEVQFDIISDFAKQQRIKFIKFPSFKKSKYDNLHLQQKYNLSPEKVLEYQELLNHLESQKENK